LAAGFRPDPIKRFPRLPIAAIWGLLLRGGREGREKKRVGGREEGRKDGRERREEEGKGREERVHPPF